MLSMSKGWTNIPWSVERLLWIGNTDDQSPLSLLPRRLLRFLIGRLRLWNHLCFANAGAVNYVICVLELLFHVGGGDLQKVLMDAAGKDDRVATHLCNIFDQMVKGRCDDKQECISLKPLFHSFGWGPTEACIAHDPFEFLLVLLDALPRDASQIFSLCTVQEVVRNHGLPSVTLDQHKYLSVSLRETLDKAVVAAFEDDHIDDGRIVIRKRPADLRPSRLLIMLSRVTVLAGHIDLSTRCTFSETLDYFGVQYRLRLIMFAYGSYGSGCYDVVVVSRRRWVRLNDGRVHTEYRSFSEMMDAMSTCAVAFSYLRADCWDVRLPFEAYLEHFFFG